MEFSLWEAFESEEFLPTKDSSFFTERNKVQTVDFFCIGHKQNGQERNQQKKLHFWKRSVPNAFLI